MGVACEAVSYTHLDVYKRQKWTPNDKMPLREIYNEMWKLDAKCNKEKTIGTIHENNDKKVERMTKDDWERWCNNLQRMKNEGTGGNICTCDRAIHTGGV